MSSAQIEITILFFAKAREILDRSEITIQIKRPESLNQSGLFDLLETWFPQLKALKRSFALALNEEYLDSQDNNIVLQNKDQLAVIPPISGG